MADNDRQNSPIQSIQPVRKIRAQLFKRERRELTYLYERNHQGQATKRKKPGIQRTKPLTSDVNNPEELEQDLIEYKADLKTRLAFDRAQILPVEPSSER